MRQARGIHAVPALTAALALACGLAACGGGATPGASMTAGQPGMGKPTVTLGTKNVTEQFVLGQLYKQALEAKGFTVELKQNLGSTAIADRALRSGQIDLYPEYIGTFDTTVAGDQMAYPTVQDAFTAGKAYAAKHGATLLPLTPFSDVDALAVLPGYASTHKLESVADLAAIKGLRIGAPPDFRLRQAGLLGLARVYGVTDTTFAPLTIGLQYQALDDGTIDVADVRTTDGQLKGGTYAVLKDPQNVFGFENVTPVVSTQVLAAEGPAFRQTLDAVSAKLTTPAMQQMNAAVAIDKQAPADVAQEFLHANGLA